MQKILTRLRPQTLKILRYTKKNILLMKQRTKQEQFEETKTKTQAGRNYKNLFISLQQKRGSTPPSKIRNRRSIRGK